MRDVIEVMYPDAGVKNDDIEFLSAGWGSREAQIIRYTAINRFYARYVDGFVSTHGRNPRTLEIGCGFGVFYDRFAVKEGFKGCDANPQAIAHAKARYDAEAFFEIDMLAPEFDEFLADFKPDYVVASGVFDHSIIWKAITKDGLLSRIVDATGYAVIMTMLSDTTKPQYRNAIHQQHVEYLSPNDVLGLFAGPIAEQELFYAVSSDYMDNDFCLALVKPGQLRCDPLYRAWKS